MALHNPQAFLVGFLLFWKISLNPSQGHFLAEGHTVDKDKTIIVMYNGTSIKELVSLCRTGYKTLYDPYKPTATCPPVERGLNRETLGEEDYNRIRRERWKDLRKAQITLKTFQEKLKLKTYIAQFVFLGCNFVIGVYLTIVGHFNFRTMYDMYAHDPTSGIPCWQFLRMRYMAKKV